MNKVYKNLEKNKKSQNIRIMKTELFFNLKQMSGHGSHVHHEKWFTGLAKSNRI